MSGGVMKIPRNWPENLAIFLFQLKVSGSAWVARAKALALPVGARQIQFYTGKLRFACGTLSSKFKC
jgi:hypothetical protein